MDREERFDDLLLDCPNCGVPQPIEKVQTSATVTTPVVPFRDNENDSIDVEQHGSEMHVKGGRVDRFQCQACGYQLNQHKNVDRPSTLAELIEVVQTTDLFVTKEDSE